MELGLRRLWVERREVKDTRGAFCRTEVLGASSGTKLESLKMCCFEMMNCRRLRVKLFVADGALASLGDEGGTRADMCLRAVT